MSEQLATDLTNALFLSEFPWWEWDIPANTVKSNDRKATMLGYDPREFSGVGYQKFTTLLHPDDYARTMQAMRDHLAGKAALYQVDYRIRRKDGAFTWYMDRGAIISRTDNGSPAAVRGIVLDLGPDLHDQALDEILLPLIRYTLPGPDSEREGVTLCSNCHKLKLSENHWVTVTTKTTTAFHHAVSHGLCPDCFVLLYPEHQHLLNR